MGGRLIGSRDRLGRRSMRRRIAVASVAACAAAGTVAGGVAPVAAADPIPLGAVAGFSIGAVAITSSACEADGSGTFTFTATATVTGSLPGAYIETGTVEIGSPVERFGSVWNPVISYSSTFSLTSPNGSVAGTQSLLEPSTGWFGSQAVNQGNCVTGGNRELSIETRWVATVTDFFGVVGTDQGVGRVFAGVDRFVSPGNVFTIDLASTPVWATPDPGVVDVWVTGTITTATNVNAAVGDPFVLEYSFEKSARATSRGNWGASFPTGAGVTITIGNSIVGSTDGILYLYGGGSSYVLMPNGFYVESGDPLSTLSFSGFDFTMNGDPGMTNGHDLPLDPSAIVANSRVVTARFGSSGGCFPFEPCDAGTIEMTVVSVSLTPPTPVDTTPPTATITTPAASATYDLGAVVTADYSCSDDIALASADACVGTVASGAALDTSTPGSHTFSVTATDAAGLTSTTSATYTVSSSLAAGLSLSGSFTSIPVDATVTVLDEGAAGVTVAVAGTGVDKVVMSVCGGFTVRIAPGSSVTLSCGSVIAAVAVGSVEIDRSTPTGVVTMALTAGGRATLGDDGGVTVAPTSTTPATVTSGGVTTTVSAGGSLAWRATGFYRPVAMDTVNRVEARSTVPLKFEIFYGSTEITTTTAIGSIVRTQVSCATWTALGSPVTVTGAQYHMRRGEFEAAVRMPAAERACYCVTMTTTSGLALSARFRTT